MTSLSAYSVEDLSLNNVHTHYCDTLESYFIYYSPQNPNYEQLFSTMSELEVYQVRDDRVKELDLTSSLTLLSFVEAKFRLDYLERVDRRFKDSLSKSLKEIHNRCGEKASLEADIFPSWKEASSNTRLIGDLKSSLKYRHWLAHGRYWLPKLGRRYEYIDIYQLSTQAESLLNAHKPKR